MKTKIQPTGTVYCFDSQNVLQGMVTVRGGWWRYMPLNPVRALAPIHSRRIDGLENAAEDIDCLWPPPVLTTEVPGSRG